MLNETKTREEALKTKLFSAESFAKTLQEEIQGLNKEFSLFKVGAAKAEVKLKSDLDEVESDILRTHEASFKKTPHQVKFFFLKNVDLSLFDVDK